MENIKKENENLKETENKVNKNLEATEEEQKETKLFVKREKFTATDGNDYYNYALYGSVRGRDIKVDFAPEDVGGYEVLEIVFDKKDEVELIVKIGENTGSDGKKMRYNSFILRSFDEEDNFYYECPVKPSRKSDKALLTMLLRKLNIEIV